VKGFPGCAAPLPLSRERARGDPNADRDFAAVRKLDAVPGKIQEDLSKADLVSDQAVRHVGRGAAGKEGHPSRRVGNP
jgi:hypothetical protein